MLVLELCSHLIQFPSFGIYIYNVIGHTLPNSAVFEAPIIQSLCVPFQQAITMEWNEMYVGTVQIPHTIFLIPIMIILQKE